MQLRRVVFIVLAGLLTVSCSDHSASEQNSKTQDAPSPHERAVEDGKREGGQSSFAAESTGDEHERGRSPGEDVVAEDCVAFVRSTKAAAPNVPNPDCPQCPPATDGKEVLKFERINIDRTNCIESSCEVNVSIHATFNPAVGGNIAGGLTGWISPEQKTQYSEGRTPLGEQVYKVKVIYRRGDKGWRAIEFDRP